MKQFLLIISVAFYISTSVNATPVFSVLQPSNDGQHHQFNIVFGAFNAHRQQNGVALSWNTVLDEDIVSFSIERSYDGTTFGVIAQVAPMVSSWQRFKDDAVFPGYIYYRIIAHMSNGTTQYSSIEMVRIVSKK